VKDGVVQSELRNCMASNSLLHYRLQDEMIRSPSEESVGKVTLI
jgi:hypothetical protein